MDSMNSSNRYNIDGIILAAGKGARSYPSNKYTPKALFRVGGKTLLERNIEIMTNQLKLNKIIVVVGHLKKQIIEHLNELEIKIDLEIVEQRDQLGIAHALSAAENYITSSKFIVMLGDEFYYESNHSKLIDYYDDKCDGVLVFKKEMDYSRISNNFTGNFENNRILSLEEKPKNNNSRLMGVGTYLLNKKVFQYIQETSPSKLRNEIEITEVLSTMASKENITYIKLNGGYFNVSNRSELNKTNYFYRNNKFSEYNVSVIIPAFNEESSIAYVIDDYKTISSVNEIIVIDNNSIDNTIKISERSGAKVIVETQQGYGSALKRGIAESSGDLILLIEGDGSFKAHDLSKFLEYIKECDMVIGTRTTRQMIEQGSNMDYITRWANVFVAKLIEILWWNSDSGVTPRFTDVGCTYRLIWKENYNIFEKFLNSTGPEFSVEMMVAMLNIKMRIIEIPISYYKRLGGESKHSANYYKKYKTALQMLKIIFKYRFC